MATATCNNALRLPATWRPLRPHPVQGALFYSPARFIAVPAGRRSGKTEIAKRRLVLALLDTTPRPWPDPRYFYGAPTERQAKRIAWEQLRAMIPPALICRIRESELFVETITGSRLYIIGFDKPARFEGPPWDGGVLDESCDYKLGVFDRTVRPALADRAGWCWRIGVPKRFGTSAPEFRAFCDACASGSYADGACFTWPSWDILPAEEVKQARDTLDPKDFNEQFGASWETVGGGIFYAFSREYNVRPVEYHRDRAIIVGSDFNVDPMCWTIGHTYPDRIEWFDEIFLRDANTIGTLDVLYQRYQDHCGGFQFYGDATGKARDTAAAETDYAQIMNDPRFKRLGRTVHYPASNPSQADRFAACNAMLLNASGDRRMFIDPRCARLIADLEQRHYKPGTREPEDTGDLGHITDAMGYAVHRLFPVKIRIDAPSQSVVLTR